MTHAEIKRVIFLSTDTSDCFKILHSSLLEHELKSYRENFRHFYFQGHILTIFVKIAKIQFWRERAVIDPDSDRKSLFWLYNFLNGLSNYLHAKFQRKNDFHGNR